MAALKRELPDRVASARQVAAIFDKTLAGVVEKAAEFDMAWSVQLEIAAKSQARWQQGHKAQFAADVAAKQAEVVAACQAQVTQQWHAFSAAVEEAARLAPPTSTLLAIETSGQPPSATGRAALILLQQAVQRGIGRAHV